MSDGERFNGWAYAGLPVVAGAAPVGARSLAALADRPAFERLASDLIAATGARCQAALTIIHNAAYAVTSVLLAPLLVDGVALNKEPCEHSCPTCPQYCDDAARLRTINAWLGVLTESAFKEVTGRKRLT